MHMEIRQAAAKLVSMNYTSDNSDFSSRGVFRINGDTLSIRPADRNDTIIRVEFFGDEIDRVTECDAVNYKARARSVSCGNLSGLSLCDDGRKNGTRRRQYFG